MIVFPNAKINIGLRILRKRRDGFHDIESLFYPVGLSDMLEILPADPSLNAGKDELSVSGLDLSSAADNLCLKAAGLFREKLGIPYLRIHLHKNIPLQSGLGGGSSDASFTLMALNEMFGKNLDNAELGNYASVIGSDCPFFIQNKPCLVSGRGDKIEPVDLSLGGYFLVLLFPEVPVSTAKAYSMVTPSEQGPPLIEYLLVKPPDWKFLPGNRFEEPLVRAHPEIGMARDLLYDRGAVYASMSGSGSAVYGLFTEDPGRNFGGFSFYSERLV